DPGDPWEVLPECRPGVRRRVARRYPRGLRRVEVGAEGRHVRVRARFRWWTHPGCRHRRALRDPGTVALPGWFGCQRGLVDLRHGRLPGERLRGWGHAFGHVVRGTLEGSPGPQRVLMARSAFGRPDLPDLRRRTPVPVTATCHDPLRPLSTAD